MGKKILVTRTSLPPYEEYIEKIKPLWESHWVTNMGDNYKELERNLKEYLHIPYLSLLVNGHMALEMAIQAMNFPEGSEVITTPFTFVSTTHAIVRNRLKPVFCDIKLADYTIDESKIENLITEKTVAIIPVHVYGNICNLEEIQRIADKYNLKVIYDAAHAFGEEYCGKGIANFGDAATFSFHATKVYNTIEGGAVAVKSKDLYEKLYDLKNFGVRGEELVVSVGANAKMNEFSAVMGLCNLKYVDDNISTRKYKTSIYMNELETLEKQEKLIIQKYDQKNVKYNYSYFPIRFCGEAMREVVFEALRKENIFPRKYFYPLTSDSACFNNKYLELPLENARVAARSILALPLYPDLADADIIRICQIIRGQMR